MRVENDYRALAPRLITDPNGNRSEAAFDVLGMVVATAVKGKVSEHRGDLLEDFDADPTARNAASFHCRSARPGAITPGQSDHSYRL